MCNIVLHLKMHIRHLNISHPKILVPNISLLFLWWLLLIEVTLERLKHAIKISGKCYIKSTLRGRKKYTWMPTKAEIRLLDKVVITNIGELKLSILNQKSIRLLDKVMITNNDSWDGFTSIKCMEWFVVSGRNMYCWLGPLDKMCWAMRSMILCC